MTDETPAEEFHRLVVAHNEPDSDSAKEEAWNQIADFALEHADTIVKALSPSRLSSNDEGVTDQPERLWLSAPDEEHEHAVWFDPDEGGTEYVRADLAQPPTTKLRFVEDANGDWVQASDLEAAQKALSEANGLADYNADVADFHDKNSARWLKRAETAEARIEQLEEFAGSFHITVVDNTYKDVSLHLDSPHALSLRLGNDSSKSWIFADLEARRRAALHPQQGAEE